MAFDEPTRGRLRRFVGDARQLLVEEFMRQVQQEYGLDPVSGEVAPLDKLAHFDDRRLETARLLREIHAHYLATEAGKGEDANKAVLQRIVREQAFTILNRLVALRMMEARGLLIPSVARGDRSDGFQLYERVAGRGLGDTGETYRQFLLSLFDEFSEDLPALFDRHAPQGRLFPRTPALNAVLAEIDHPDLEPLWAEDETIGWIYQYFNSREERKAMRDASQAPRNSRELAVRNQFFTPRYVVEFLVDNTLGRLWFNWTGGQTGLRERWQYLLVKPDENPEAAQALRDPRTIKLLDPACGSMHFGLYAFDLFMDIYREAWEWEEAHGPGCLDMETGGGGDLKPLCQTYADQAAFLHDVPRLIIEHNIYGVEIDPRAAQIASLALWLRAQRAWHEAGAKARDRPQVGRGNVVAAVAPPADVELRRRFMEALDDLDAELFERTLFLLKGLPELGVLLQVERELPSLIREVFGEHGELFRAEDMAQWQKAETRLREALTEFARAAQSTYQGRLFAHDALQGLRLIDVTREMMDVVVMNPPFGEAAEPTRDYQKQTYPHCHQDIFQCFVERAVQLTRMDSMVGVLSARTGFFMGDSEGWRTEVIWRNRLLYFADLGLGVLDEALVEAAAYVLQAGDAENHQIVATRHLSTRDKEASLLNSARNMAEASGLQHDTFIIFQNIIKTVPGGVFAYWAPPSFLARFNESNSFQANVATVRQGLATADDFRFVRLAWEVLPSTIGAGVRWRRFSKGGEYSPPYDDIHLLVEWGKDGEQLKASICKKYPYLNGNWSFVIKNSSLYFQPGATYTVRTASAFAAKALPAGCIFSHNAQSWFVGDDDLLLKSVVYFLCRTPQAYLELAVGGGDIATSGSAARRYTTKVVNSVPSSIVSQLDYQGFDDDCRSLFRFTAHEQSIDETTCFFAGYPVDRSRNIRELAQRTVTDRQHLITEALEASYRIDLAVTALWELSAAEFDYVKAEVGHHPCEYNEDVSERKIGELLVLTVDELIRRGVKEFGASRWLTKKSYFVDRKTELICHMLSCSPVAIERVTVSLYQGVRGVSEQLFSYAVGVAFGRWRTDPSDKSAIQRFIERPFDQLPRLPAAAKDDNFEGEILTSDSGHSRSLLTLIEQALHQLWPGNSDIVSQLSDELGCNLQQYFQKQFFSEHLAQYGKSRRKAPIYWPLSTGSGSYTLWVYYPGLTSQTLYTAINDFLEHKLKQVGQEVTALRAKGAARTRDDDKRFEGLHDFEQELIELRDTLLGIAPTYRPNHDDGVQITAAPLWPLFRHKPWQKVLKDTWTKLEKGDYDWAHLAFAYWPDRVREKCKTDKSLAIAHDLEHLYVEPDATVAKARGRKPKRTNT